MINLLLLETVRRLQGLNLSLQPGLGGLEILQLYKAISIRDNRSGVCNILLRTADKLFSLCSLP